MYSIDNFPVDDSFSKKSIVNAERNKYDKDVKENKSKSVIDVKTNESSSNPLSASSGTTASSESITSQCSTEKNLLADAKKSIFDDREAFMRQFSEAIKNKDFKKLSESFRDEYDIARTLIGKRVDEILKSPLAVSLKDPVSFIKHAGRTLNEATGYSEIERLKQEIELKAQEFQDAKQSLKDSKEQYRICVETRAKGQRDINNLLQRKHSWVDEDVNLFTKLYRDEHQNEQLEQQSKDETKRWEDLVEVRYDQLVAAIRTRYHEEQLWSDKIRGASTYWTLALILLNTLMFLSVHTIFEPRKRAKLVEKVQENFSQTWEEGTFELKELFMKLSEKLELQKIQTSEVLSRLSVLESQAPEPKNSQDNKDIPLELIASLLGDALSPPISDVSSSLTNEVSQPQNKISLGYSDAQLGLLALTSATLGAFLSTGLLLMFNR